MAVMLELLSVAAETLQTTRRCVSAACMIGTWCWELCTPRTLLLCVSFGADIVKCPQRRALLGTSVDFGPNPIMDLKTWTSIATGIGAGDRACAIFALLRGSYGAQLCRTTKKRRVRMPAEVTASQSNDIRSNPAYQPCCHAARVVDFLQNYTHPVDNKETYIRKLVRCMPCCLRRVRPRPTSSRGSPVLRELTSSTRAARDRQQAVQDAGDQLGRCRRGVLPPACHMPYAGGGIQYPS